MGRAGVVPVGGRAAEVVLLPSVLRIGVGVVDVADAAVGRAAVFVKDDVLDDSRRVELGEGLVELTGVLRVVGTVLPAVTVLRLARVDEVALEPKGRRAIVLEGETPEDATEARLGDRVAPGVDDGLLWGDTPDVEATRRPDAVELRRGPAVVVEEPEREGVEGDLRREEELEDGAKVREAAVEDAAVVDREARVDEVARVADGTDEAVRAAALLKVDGIGGRALVVIVEVFVRDEVAGLIRDADPVVVVEDVALAPAALPVEVVKGFLTAVVVTVVGLSPFAAAGAAGNFLKEETFLAVPGGVFSLSDSKPGTTLGFSSISTGGRSTIDGLGGRLSEVVVVAIVPEDKSWAVAEMDEVETLDLSCSLQASIALLEAPVLWLLSLPVLAVEVSGTVPTALMLTMTLSLSEESRLMAGSEAAVRGFGR